MTAKKIKEAETEKFLNQHFDFKTVWKTIKINSAIKKIKTMKKIQKFQCLDFKYVDGIFFEKDAFYLELK